jgi:hypothetical protein
MHAHLPDQECASVGQTTEAQTLPTSPRSREMIKTAIRRFPRLGGYHVCAAYQFPLGFNWMLDVERKPDGIKTIFDVGANSALRLASPSGTRKRSLTASVTWEAILLSS